MYIILTENKCNYVKNVDAELRNETEIIYGNWLDVSRDLTNIL